MSRAQQLLVRLVTVTSTITLVALLFVDGLELVYHPTLNTMLRSLAIASITLSLIRDFASIRAQGGPVTYLKGHALELLLLIPIAIVPLDSGTWALCVWLRQAMVIGRLASHNARYQRYMRALQTRPAFVLVLSFLGIIAIGTLLLTFPRATTDGQGAPVLDAVFTSTSATCVTGLVTLNTVEDRHGNPHTQSFTPFGQLVILILIQIGGLGIMTLSAAVIVLMGRRLTLRNAELMQSILDEQSTAALKKAFRDILAMTFVVETLGALLLFLRFFELTDDGAHAAWLGIFHAVSAFCNAGFSLFGDSLASFADDTYLNLVHSLLIIIGGLGFGVVMMLVARRTWEHGVSSAWRRLALQARLVLTMSLVLIVSGTILYYFLEYDHSLDGRPIGEKLLASFFQSVSFRTAGFNTVDLAQMSHATLIIACVWMFIGASPGSCGGGVKTTTVGILLMSIRASLVGRHHVEIGRQTVPSVVVNRAVSIVSIALATLILGVLLLLLSQPHLSFKSIVFEAVSAIGTVGLSLGATSELNGFGKLIIISLMFIGRLGPLTIALAVGERRNTAALSYPEGRFIVG